MNGKTSKLQGLLQAPGSKNHRKVVQLKEAAFYGIIET